MSKSIDIIGELIAWGIAVRNQNPFIVVLRYRSLQQERSGLQQVLYPNTKLEPCWTKLHDHFKYQPSSPLGFVQRTCAARHNVMSRYSSTSCSLLLLLTLMSPATFARPAFGTNPKPRTTQADSNYFLFDIVNLFFALYL